MAKKENLWIGLRPVNPEPIHTLRRTLRSVLPDGFVPERDPHITVLRCNLPANRRSDLTEQVRRQAFIGRDFSITGFRCHPDPLSPRVIMLDADLDLETERNELRDQINSYGGQVLREPVQPHLTLWRRADGQARELTDQTAQGIAEEIANHHTESRFTAQIGAIEVSTF